MTCLEQNWDGWWAECDTCLWKAGPCDTEAEVQADQHDLARGEVTPGLIPPDGEEPDLAAEYERMRRARLEGATTEGGEAIGQP
jgi:hypothetical protein